MTFLLLRRFWPHLAVAGGIIAGGLWLRHSGYESGAAARDAYWQTRFAAAERARDAANTRAQSLEAASIALSGQIERQYADTTTLLHLRAADAERRITGLVRELAARPRRCPLPEAGGSSPVPDATPEVDPRADTVGRSIAAVGSACESDAAQLSALQSWVREQISLMR